MRRLFWCTLIIGFVLNNDAVAQPDLDTTFNSTGKVELGVRGAANDVVIQPDNKIVMVSACTTIDGPYNFCAVRLNENGSQDFSFQGGCPPVCYGFVVDSMGAPAGQGGVRGIAIQSDGKLVLVGYVNQDLALLRLNPSGSTDSSFGTSGRVFTDVNPGYQDRAMKVVIQPDGKIVVVGYSRIIPSGSYQQFVARYTANGMLDASFGVGGITRTLISGYETGGASIVLQNDGKILAGGHMSTVSGSPNPSASYLIVRLNPDGSRDTTWDGDGILSIVLGIGANPEPGGFLSLALQTDGRVVALGYTNIIYRFNTDGSLDLGFDGDGSRPALNASNVDVYDLIVSAGGKITVVGLTKIPQLGSVPMFYLIARFKPNGSPDPGLSDDGYLSIDVGSGPDGAMAVAADSQGRIVVGGTTGLGQIPNPYIPGVFSAARLTAPVDPVIPGMLFDFDGDRMADIAVYRDGATPNAPSYWHILRSYDGVYQGFQLGANGDKPVPSDYNGDGRCEVAVWRPSTGTWYTSTNPATNYGAFQWGQNGDVPLPGDFDGDGKADYAVYRPANGFWYVLRSSNGVFQQQQFGTSADKPLLADFDGDDKTDFAYYSPGATPLAASFWNVIQSSTGATSTVQFGRGEDIPVPGDYDGDGLTNFAVFRPSTSIWYTSLNPATNYGAFQWGAVGDVSAPAHYDNDAKTDFAIFRPGTTVWYILNSGNGSVIGQQWGLASDRPVPSSFVP